MKIANIRLGFATNSSSSHSIVILPPGKLAPTSEAPGWDGNYGWDNFVLKDKTAKMEYLAASFGVEIEDLYGPDIAGAVMKEFFAGVNWTDDWNVDHQSRLDPPLDAVTGQISRAFVEDFKAFLGREDVIVLGGNDNSEQFVDSVGLADHRFDVSAIEETGIMWRAMKTGQWWTLFNPRTGGKVRFTFHAAAPSLQRSTAPELIDMKITDYCPFDCPYCYQGSTDGGKHARLEDILGYLNAMKRSGVFEVALGGGEPTLHPDFIRILRTAREFDVVPNFTTKVTPDKWSADLLRAVRDYAGAFAVSVENAAQLAKLAAAGELYNLKGRISAHYVVGWRTDYSLRRVIAAAKEHRIPLTLLGFKHTGRGATHPANTRDYLTADVLRDAGRLSVDTAFVDLHGDVLRDAGVPDVLVVPGEGRFSMYIDAVTERAGVSSYHVDTLRKFEAPGWGDLSGVWSDLGKVDA